MEQVTKDKYAFGFWMLVLGFVLCWATLYLGFSWMTQGAALKMAADSKQPLAVELCVKNFMAEDNFTENLAAMKAKKWSKGDYIEEGKWDIMTGDEKAIIGVASKCAYALDELPE